MAAKEFAFVEVDINGRVTDKNHLHTIRKHIMKDIGKARRKPIFSTSQYIANSNVTTLRDIRVNKTQEEDDFIVPTPESGFLGSGHEPLSVLSRPSGYGDPFSDRPSL
jgi:hypothetical protein